MSVAERRFDRGEQVGVGERRFDRDEQVVEVERGFDNGEQVGVTYLLLLYSTIRGHNKPFSTHAD